MIFTCPRCKRTKDFGATYIPPLGRSYICHCGLSTIVRPTWGSDGQKTLISAGPPEPAPATEKQQKAVTVQVDAVKERLAREEAAKRERDEAAKLAREQRETTDPGNEAASPKAIVDPAQARVFPPPPKPATAPAAPVRAPAPPVSAPPRPLPAPIPIPPQRAPTPPAAAAPPRPLPAPIPPRPPAPPLDAPAPPPVAASAPDRTERVDVRATPLRPPGVLPPAPPKMERTERIDIRPAPASGFSSSQSTTAEAEAVSPRMAAPELDDRPTLEPLSLDDDLDEITEIDPEDPFPALKGPNEGWTIPSAIPAAAPVVEVTAPEAKRPTPSAIGVVPEVAATAEPSEWQLELTTPGPALSAVPGADPLAEPSHTDRLPRPNGSAQPVPVEVTEPQGHDGLAEILEPSIVEVTPKPKRRLWVRALILAAQITLPLVLFGAGLGWVEYRQLQNDLPSIASIKNYRPPIVTEIRDREGTLIGRYAEEERYVVSLDELPPHVTHAFLAAEDADFYKHSGVDPKSILRALLKNVQTGKSAQGGSTITQQVARTFLLSRQKTYTRKIQEILLARKIEQSLTKDEILHRYLNQIFFGHGAYGVEAAARIHFAKHAKDLTIAEAATLAGLPQAPSRYAPELHPDEALRRRTYVLGQMVANGWITRAESDAALKEKLTLASMPDPTLIVAPYTTEQIRRTLMDKFGKDAVLRGGLQVTATVDAKLEAQAQSAVRDGLVMLDHRIGWRGASGHADADKIGATVAALGATAPAAGAKTKAVLEEVTAEHAYAKLAGGAIGVLHVADNPFAYAPNPEAYWKYRTATDLTKVMHAGDVVDVEVLDAKSSTFVTLHEAASKKKGFKPDAKLEKKLEGRLVLRLVQEPELQGALLSFHVPDGRVLAMVGGTDFAKSQFIRPLQAKRQVGSTFKTVVYAAALSKLPPEILDPENHPRHHAAKPGAVATPPPWFTLGTILQDAPLVMTPKEAELTSKAGGNKESDEAQEQWKPANYGNKYYGDTPLRTAFVLSRNLPTLQLAQKIGVKEIISFARKLGIENDLPPDLSLALGSASLSLLELTRAHAVFATGGLAVEPKFVERVVDRDGKVLLDLQKDLETQEANGGATRILDEKPAFVMTQLLEDVARFGTSSKAMAEFKRASGGKTGTTNDYIDAWYVGFTPSVVTGVWVGYDQVKSLGLGETGGEAAAPIWVNYMKAALEGTPKEDFHPPEGVVKVKIERTTGKLARPGQNGDEIVETWFVQGTEPTEVARFGKINEQPNIFQADPGLR